MSTLNKIKYIWQDMMTGYCTWFPDTFLGVYIGDCCKIHDSECSTHKFFICLRNKLTYSWSAMITTGGAIGCWFKYTKRMFGRL